jgi:hypothetical protein
MPTQQKQREYAVIDSVGSIVMAGPVHHRKEVPRALQVRRSGTF